MLDARPSSRWILVMHMVYLLIEVIQPFFHFAAQKETDLDSLIMQKDLPSVYN